MITIELLKIQTKCNFLMKNDLFFIVENIGKA